jgi:hypothetical protein
MVLELHRKNQNGNTGRESDMQKLLVRLFFSLFSFSLLAAVSAGQLTGSELDRVQSEWVAVLQAPLSEAEKGHALRNLAQRAEHLAARDPSQLDAQLWHVMIASSYNQIRGDDSTEEAVASLQRRLEQPTE